MYVFFFNLLFAKSFIAVCFLKVPQTERILLLVVAILRCSSNNLLKMTVGLNWWDGWMDGWGWTITLLSSSWLMLYASFRFHSGGTFCTELAGPTTLSMLYTGTVVIFYMLLHFTLMIKRNIVEVFRVFFFWFGGNLINRKWVI